MLSSPSAPSHAAAPDQPEIILDLLLNQKKPYVQDYMRAAGLDASGNKEQIRQRLADDLSSGRVTFAQLVEWLDAIEGWGDQHVYLFQARDAALEPWQSEASARQQVTLGGPDWVQLFNQSRSLVLPDAPTLAGLRWSQNPARLRVVWVEKREARRRLEQLDRREAAPPEYAAEGELSSEIAYLAYQVITVRSVSAFDVDLTSGAAMLLIHASRGANYRQLRGLYEQMLRPVIELRDYEPLRLSGAVRAIQDSREVQRRELSYRTKQDSIVSFLSSSYEADVMDDPVTRAADRSLKGSTSGLLGEFYWHAGEQLSEKLHTRLYTSVRSDQRVSIIGRYREEDVRHVLSRIRHFGRTAP